VVVAEQGAEGLERLKRERFDVVVSDLEMPVMDGWKFAAAVRRLEGRDHMPLLALTTLASTADQQRALDCGFDAFQVKLDRAEFLKTVDRLLQQATLAQSEGAR
jgi:two-component system chemotaxis sensor kinase CheA